MTTSVLAMLVVNACRFGGPSGDPTLPVADAATGVGGGGQAGNAGTGGNAGQGGSGGAAGDGGSSITGGSAGATVDASDDVSSDAPDDVLPDAGFDGDAGWFDADLDAGFDTEQDGTPPTVCVPPFSSAVCDPVCNTACPALFRCDITEIPRTGVCVGTLLSNVPEGMACARTALTDDCLERLTCLEGTCRRLCYRDADCTTAGTCCTGAIDVDGGASGYRYCAPCGP